LVVQLILAACLLDVAAVPADVAADVGVAAVHLSN